MEHVAEERSTKMNRRLSALIVLIGAISYGIPASLVKIGLSSGYTVGEIIGSQMLTAALFLWVFTFIKGNRSASINWKTVVLLILAGTLSGLTGIFYYSSMERIPASIAIVLLFQFTWIGSLYEWMFHRRKPSARTYIVLVIILVGTFFASDVFSGQFQNLSPIGIVFGLLSAFTFAGFIYVSGNVATKVNAWYRSALMVTGSCIIALIVFPPVYLISGALVSGLWKYALATALLSSAIPTVCFTIGVPHLKNGIATILSSVELPVAVIMAWIVLKEPVEPLQWVGIFLILGAIVLSEYETLKKEKRKAVG